MATTTILSTGVRNDKGTVFGGGNIGSSRFRTLSMVTNAYTHSKFTPVYPSWKTGVESILKGSAVSITAISQSGSTGFVNIQKSTHGLSVGSLIVVYGADVAAYNTIHRVTVVTDANNVKTDVFFTSNPSSVHGSYKAFSGDFAKLTAQRYIGTIIGNYVAGSANSVLRITSADYYRVPYNPARGNYRYHISSIDAVTGVITKGASAGVQVKYHDVAANNDNLANETFPSKAVPGELVYDSGHRNGPTMADYPARG